MASANDRQTSSIKKRLLEHSHSFNYFQAVRLLQTFAEREGKSVKISPKPSMAFPSNDIDSIVEHADNYQLVVNFLGLYSSDSPLPAYYLEQWLEQINDDDLSVKEFLDIFHQRLYELLYASWEKGRLYHKLKQKKDKRVKKLLYNLAGVSFTDDCAIMEQQPGLHRYLRFFMRGNKNILNLRILLQQYLNLDVDVESFYHSPMKIHQKQLNSLAQRNHGLGMNCYLGSIFPSVNTNILIKLNQLTLMQFEELMPNKKLHEELKALLRFYFNKPLNCFLELNLADDQAIEKELVDKAQTLLGEKSWLGEMKTSDRYQLIVQIA